MRKSLCLLLFLVALALSGLPCAEASGRNLIYAVDKEPSGLDPNLVTAHASIRVHKQIYSTLLETDASMDLIPDLAERWEEGPDNTYTFHLRKGVKFHNGRELTADDVLYTYNRILNPDVGSIARSYFSRVKAIEALDPYTVKFTLSSPDATFLNYTASNYAGIVPKEVVEEHGDLKKVTCGTGPFRMKEYVEGNKIVLERNPDYFIEGEPRLDTLTFLVMPDEASRLAALRTKSVHLAVLSSANLPLVKNNKDIVVMDYLSSNYDFLGFNLTKKPFDDVRVRQAVALLIDRQEIIDAIYDGNAVPTGPCPPSMTKWAIDVERDALYKPDAERARKLLAEAGYPDGFSMEITAGINKATTDAAQIIQSQLAKGNIKTSIRVLETAQYIDAWKHRTHDSMIGMNGGGSDPDRSLDFFFTTGAPANVWGYSNPEVDKLNAEGRETTDFESRRKIYARAQEILLHDLPTVFLECPKAFFFVRKEVKGYRAETYDSENFVGVTVEE